MIPVAPGPSAVPAGWRLRVDPSTRRLAEGSVLIGGTPLRVLTLAPAGARLVAGWCAGAPVGVEPREGLLARRLLDAGLAHPEPVGGPDVAACTVVIPVRDRPHELRRCLAALDSRCPVVVVDDASVAPGAIAAAAEEHGARLVRQSQRGGAGASRNAGLAVTDTPWVAFLDSDCVPGPGFPARLIAHLGDPALALVAPRVVALHPGRGLLGEHETHHSALDMGAKAGRVRPGTVVSYVPSAALVARTAALGTGFDPDLPYGEDVDLAWRLDAAGWQVRYDPSVRVAHDHRMRPGAWFARRVGYDTATAPLARRHPHHLPALVLSRLGIATWGALAVGRPGVAAGAAGAGAAMLRTRLAPRLPRATTTATRLALGGHLHEGRELGRALAGPWLPATVVIALTRPAVGRRLALLVAARLVLEWAEERREPSPLHYAGPRLAADLARCLGVLSGSVRHRTIAPLRLRVR